MENTPHMVASKSAFGIEQEKKKKSLFNLS